MTILVGIVLFFTMLLIAKVAKPLLNKQGRIMQESYTQVNKWLLQMVNGIKVITVGNKKEFFRENFSLHGKCLVRAERWNTLLQNVPRLLIEMASVVSMLIALLVAVCSGMDVSSLIPTIAAFGMAALKLMPSANRISTALNQVAYYEPSLDKLLESLQLIEREKEEKEKEVGTNENIKIEILGGQKEPSCLRLEKEVELRQISYSYPDNGQYILQNANMLIPIGKSVGIVGTSGAGKTTAVDIILGLLNPQSGEVLADGVPVQEHYEEWLSHIGYIPQMIFMLDDTVRANVMFGHSDDGHADEKVWAALEEAQMADFVRSLPKGIDTAIGERGVRLSGGQRQRIGIARALFTNPDVLILDEATSALDSETEEAIMQSINSLHGKKTMVIIAHRLTTIEGCDMVYHVEDKKFRKEVK